VTEKEIEEEIEREIKGEIERENSVYNTIQSIVLINYILLNLQHTYFTAYVRTHRLVI
jgi:hypothetical protein